MENNNNNVNLGANFWNDLYLSEDMGWDLGEVSPPIAAYIDQLENKDIAILIPGCGNTYEAEYLLKNNFTNITVVDIAPVLVEKLRKKYESNSQIKILLGDFFELQGKYDLIIEQTFFCAIDPSLRVSYIKKMKELLVKGGKLAGVLFDRDFDKKGPPFAGRREDYEPLFKNYFEITYLDACYNSFIKRKGNELFILMVNNK